MEISLDFLLHKLSEKHITYHVICPSARVHLNHLFEKVDTAIEVIDERSAGYIATGMCEEINEPIVIWCSDNDSFRNLSSSLTEAYYKKLPLLIVAIKCNSTLIHTISPLDTIRYYSNNLYNGKRDIKNDINSAIKLLYSEIKGPVYLGLDLQSCELEFNIGYIDNHFDTVNVSSIMALIPRNACIHVGKNVQGDCSHIEDNIFRYDHCCEDGNLSMLIGSSIVAKDQLHVGIFTNAEIAYDLNMLGNRHVGNNLIIFLLQQVDKVPSIYDFAKKMNWECTRVRLAEINTIKKDIKIDNHPKFIEVLI